jgi:hypothetical protein
MGGRPIRRSLQGPSSLTAIVTALPSAWIATVTVEPDGLCRTALPRRLTNAIRSRSGSTLAATWGQRCSMPT